MAPVQNTVASWAAGEPGCEMQQRGNAVRGDEVEQQGVEDVEAPAGPAGGDDQPVIPGKPEKPRA